MRGRTTWVMLLLALALGSAIVFVERQRPDAEQRSLLARRAVRIRADQVDAFDLEIEHLRLRGERTGDTWRLTHPVEAPADASAVERMLAAFETLDRRASIPRSERIERGLSLDAFGLDQPRARWALWAGGERHAFWIGRPAAVGDRVYLFEEASEEVLAVSDSVLRFLPDSAADLRERRLFPLTPGRMHRLELTRPDGFVQLIRADSGDWRIQQPRVFRVDQGAVHALADRLMEARALSFVRDGPGEDTLFGFDETGVSAFMTVERPDEPVFRLDLGAPVSDRPGERYARIGHTPGIVTVSDEVYQRIRTGLEALRDRQLFPFGPDAIRGVEITIESERLELARHAAGSWAITFPVSAPAEPAVVEALLRTWTGTRIERFLPPEEGETDSPPVRRIVFHRLDPSALPGAESRPVALWIEPPDPEGLIPLRFEDSGERVAVHPLRFRGFTTDPLAFAARRPLVFEAAHVRGFSTRHAGSAWSVSCDPSGALALERDEDERALDEVTARNQRALLLKLPVLSPVSFGTAHLAEQGLDDPETVIRIHLTGEAGLGRTLSLGRSGPAGVYVRVSGQDVTYAVDPTVAETLRTKPVTAEPD